MRPLGSTVAGYASILNASQSELYPIGIPKEYRSTDAVRLNGFSPARGNGPISADFARVFSYASLIFGSSPDILLLA